MIESILKTAKDFMKKYQIAMGRRNSYVIPVDAPSDGQNDRFGSEIGGMIFFALDETPGLQYVAVPEDENTKAKVYVLTEVCTVEMVDKSLKF